MKLSARGKQASTSITLKMSEKIDKLKAEGRYIYNMTSGQLQIKPSPLFINELSKQLNFTRSYQYSPMSGLKKLREKFIKYKEKERSLPGDFLDNGFDCIISNGSKHSLYNVFGALIDAGDEVIILTPYWVSYPEIIKVWGGVSVVIKSHAFDAYTPSIEEIKKAISQKTKAIIINSPNNPAGISYSEKWMKEFGEFLKEFPDIMVVSDEVYSELNYYDPKPRYFYELVPEIFRQTVIIGSISKSFASTGLRVGYCIADANLTKAMARIQSQTTSGPNTLVQRALIDLDFEECQKHLEPTIEQLRNAAQFLRISFREGNLSHCFYQTTCAFYYMLDFSRMPMFERYNEVAGEDYSTVIVQDILEQTGVAIVPGTDFGYPNSARMSLTLDEVPFQEAITKLVEFFTRK